MILQPLASFFPPLLQFDPQGKRQTPSTPTREIQRSSNTKQIPPKVSHFFIYTYLSIYRHFGSLYHSISRPVLTARCRRTSRTRTYLDLHNTSSARIHYHQYDPLESELYASRLFPYERFYCNVSECYLPHVSSSTCSNTNFWPQIDTFTYLQPRIIVWSTSTKTFWCFAALVNGGPSILHLILSKVSSSFRHFTRFTTLQSFMAISIQ